jgi:predicted dehydrogenase
VTAAEEKGGGAYRRRGCSGEGSGEVRGSLAITSRYGSSAVVVGVGWSTCAGGGAHWRRGIQPTNGAIVQLNGSGSFTRGQGRHAREEFENGSLDCSVYARLRATEVRGGRS